VVIFSSQEGIVKLLTLVWCCQRLVQDWSKIGPRLVQDWSKIGHCGDRGKIQRRSVSDRGYRARGVAASPVDQHGDVLDILVQSGRKAVAAKRFFCRLLNGLRYVPRVIVTDKLASYQVAHRELVPSVNYRRWRYLNNRAENSHQPTRIGERVLKRLASPGQAQRFLFAFSDIRGDFRPRRDLMSAPQWRTEMIDRFAVWDETLAAAAA
jgi:hypothetical protein